MSARGWRRSEPGDELLGAPERPELLDQALDLVQDARSMSLEDLCAQAALPEPEMRKLLGCSLDDRPAVDL